MLSFAILVRTCAVCLWTITSTLSSFLSDTLPIIDITRCTSLRSIRFRSICLVPGFAYENRLLILPILTQVSSSSFEELTLNIVRVTSSAADDWNVHFDWGGVAEWLMRPQFASLKRVCIEWPLTSSMQSSDVESFLEIGPFSPITRRGLVQLKMVRTQPNYCILHWWFQQVSTKHFWRTTKRFEVVMGNDSVFKIGKLSLSWHVRTPEITSIFPDRVPNSPLPCSLFIFFFDYGVLLRQMPQTDSVHPLDGKTSLYWALIHQQTRRFVILGWCVTNSIRLLALVIHINRVGALQNIIFR